MSARSFARFAPTSRPKVATTPPITFLSATPFGNTVVTSLSWEIPRTTPPPTSSVLIFLRSQLRTHDLRPCNSRSRDNRSRDLRNPDLQKNDPNERILPHATDSPAPA